MSATQVAQLLFNVIMSVKLTKQARASSTSHSVTGVQMLHHTATDSFLVQSYLSTILLFAGLRGVACVWLLMRRRHLHAHVPTCAVALGRPEQRTCAHTRRSTHRPQTTSTSGETDSISILNLFVKTLYFSVSTMTSTGVGRRACRSHSAIRSTATLCPATSSTCICWSACRCSAVRRCGSCRAVTPHRRCLQHDRVCARHLAAVEAKCDAEAEGPVVLPAPAQPPPPAHGQPERLTVHVAAHHTRQCYMGLASSRRCSSSSAALSLRARTALGEFQYCGVSSTIRHRSTCLHIAARHQRKHKAAKHKDAAGQPEHLAARR